MNLHALRARFSQQTNSSANCWPLGLELEYYTHCTDPEGELDDLDHESLQDLAEVLRQLEPDSSSTSHFRMLSHINFLLSDKEVGSGQAERLDSAIRWKQAELEAEPGDDSRTWA